MTDRTFSDLADKVAPSVSGCPQSVLVKYLREAAIEVCERTKMWRYEQDPIILTPGLYNYEYEAPTNTEVIGIIYSAINGTATPFVNEGKLHRLYPDWPSTDTAKRAKPCVVSQFTRKEFVLAPVPDGDTTYTIKMFLALKPTAAATGMDTNIMSELEQTIEHGALQHLLVLPDKSWSDRELATYHAKQFTFKIGRHRANANLGIGQGSLSVQNVPFA